jgi:hypothetical protein
MNNLRALVRLHQRLLGVLFNKRRTLVSWLIEWPGGIMCAEMQQDHDHD